MARTLHRNHKCMFVSVLCVRRVFLDVPGKGVGNVGVCVLSYGLILLLLTAPSGEKGFPVQYFYTLAQGCLTRSKGIMRTKYQTHL